MLHCVLLKGPYTRPTPVTPMTPSRKKTKKRNSEDGITEAVARELESIAEELKTSTVSYSKVRLRALAAGRPEGIIPPRGRGSLESTR